MLAVLRKKKNSLWGDCSHWLNAWLDKLDDNEKAGIAPDMKKPLQLRWRYDIDDMKQFREERENEGAEWIVTSTKKIRRILIPIPYK